MGAIILEYTRASMKISGPTQLITDAVSYLSVVGKFSTAWVWDIQPETATITSVADREKYEATKKSLRDWAAFSTKGKATMVGHGDRIVFQNLS